MKKIVAIILCVITSFTLLTGCNNSSQELLSSPFLMEAYKTYINGAYLHKTPDKVFNSDELFNLLNNATGEKPFEVPQVGIEYIIDMVNGSDYSTFNIWSDGTVTLNFNLLFDSEFYLTKAEYDAVIAVLEF